MRRRLPRLLPLLPPPSPASAPPPPRLRPASAPRHPALASSTRVRCGAVLGLGVVNPPAAACVIIYSITPLFLDTYGPLYIACPAVAYSAIMLLVQCGLSRTLAYMAMPAEEKLPDDKQLLLSWPKKPSSTSNGNGKPSSPKPNMVRVRSLQDKYGILTTEVLCGGIASPTATGSEKVAAPVGRPQDYF